MPEIKNQFTGGKMNKDLDERLVPKGEYRDAMNIQVSTSEGSDVGTIQNVLGNTPGCVYLDGINDPPNPIPAGSSTVGSVSDEKNDSLYWLIAGPDDINSYLPLGVNQTASVKDMIMRTNSAIDSGCEPVFVDKHAFCIGINDSTVANSISLSNPEFYSQITAGMTVSGYQSGVLDATQFPTPVASVGLLNTLTPINYMTGTGLGSSVLQPIVTRTFNLRLFDQTSNVDFNNANIGNSYSGVVSNNLPNPGESQIYMPTGGSVLPNGLSIGGQLVPGSSMHYMSGGNIIDIQQGQICAGPNSMSGCFDAYILTIDTLPTAYPSTPWCNTYSGGSFCNPASPPWDNEAATAPFLIDTQAAPITTYPLDNTIHVMPTSYQWLDEVYNILWDAPGVLSGAQLFIDNNYAGGSNWPVNSCIDPNSVIDPGDGFNLSALPQPTYDNQFSAVYCNGTVDAFGTDISGTPAIPFSPAVNHPGLLSLYTYGGNGVEAVFFNNILDFSDLDTLCFASERVLEFNRDNLITGINIIDNMLFWTDNFTEPKKINIPRSIAGTDSLGDIHTAVINDSTGLSFASYNPIRKEHITVIRKSPKNALILELQDGRDPSKTYSGITYTAVSPALNANTNVSSIIGSSNPTVFHDFSTLQNGDTVKFEIETDIDGNEDFILSWLQNESILLLKAFDEDGLGGQSAPPLPLANYDIRGRITDWQWTSFVNNTAAQDTTPNGVGSDWNGGQFPSSAPGTAHVEIEVLNLKGTPPQPDFASGAITLNYMVDLEQKIDPIFEDKFGRYSYRYKYEDGEYSTFAPWSEVAFIPGNLDYEPKTGYNVGMVNNLVAAKLKNFIPTTWGQPLGQDITEVDILYKEEGSPNVYIVETVSALDISPIGIPNAWGANEYIVKSETIKNTLPSNQLLRAWDNVPKKALAQDITGNRIVYANYEQNFDLKVQTFGPPQRFKPEFKNYLSTWRPSVNDGSEKSIKSLRDYKLGVVFTDEYGRETPILISESGGFKIEKPQSADYNRLVAGLNGAAPPTMNYFKFFIKETSSEYYNLAMDRWYDAEDGNIWLAFPSTDRNKVDLETSLYFKKGTENYLENNTRYKILDIDNEAPEFIKTRRIRIGVANHNPLNTTPIYLFGDATTPYPTSAPGVNRVSFTLNWGLISLGNSTGFEDSSISHLEDITEDLYIQFVSASGYSNQYKVSQITSDRDKQNQTADDGMGTVVPPTEYYVTLATNLKDDIDFIFDNPAGPSEILSGVKVQFTKAVVENKPIFDGRFFAKIKNDGRIKTQITDDSVGVNYIEEASRDVYVLDDDYDLINQKQVNAVYSDNFRNYFMTLLTGVNLVTYDYSTFVDNNTHVNNVGGQNWNFLAARQSYMGPVVMDQIGPGGTGYYYTCENFNLPSSPLYTVGSDFISDATFYGNKKPGVWFINRSTQKYTTSMGSGGDRLEFGVNSNMNNFSPAMNNFNATTTPSWTPISKTGRGIRNFSWSNKSNIDIAFGGIRHRFDWGDFGPNDDMWNGPDSNPGLTGFFNIGASNSPYYNDSPQIDFVERLEAGQAFSWEHDPTETVYVVENQTTRTNHVRFSRKDEMRASGDLNTEALITPNSCFHKNYNFDVKPHMSDWDPAGPPGTLLGSGGNKGLNLQGITHKDHDIFGVTTGINSNDPTINYIVVDTLTSVCSNGNTLKPVYSLHKGMMLTAYNNNAATPNQMNVIIKDVGVFDSTLASGTGGYKIELAGYYEPLGYNGVEFTTNLILNQTLTFQQVTMNGASNWTETNTDHFKTNWLDTSGSQCGPIGAVGYKMLMLKPVDEYTDGGNLPPNPYVWETEPKDNEGLDIYYEISDNLPLVLNTNTIAAAIPLGSNVINTSGEGLLDWFAFGGVQVNGNTGVSITGDTISINELVWIGPGASPPDANGFITQPLEPGSKLEITRPDGMIFDVTIQSLIPDPAVPTVSNTIVLEPSLYNSNYHLNWYNCYSFGNGVESNRIKDNFNLPYILSGVKVSTTLDEEYKQERRSHGLIYSGLYNSTSGMNNLNQFNQAEKITKDINPTYGSIQKIHARDTDLVTLCEDKILRILSNKDAVFNADGKPNLTATSNVLGQTVPFSGEYGISKNPESFASESYRAYFTDRVRGAVMRLSKDGLTPISDHGMKDWFRDNLKLHNKLIGSYDDFKDEYNITLIDYTSSTEGVDVIPPTNNIGKTVTFKEDVKGWVSFKSFVTEHGNSCANNYYTFKDANLWRHHYDVPGNRNTFYNIFTSTSFNVILNESPGVVKSFYTLNYEGSDSKVTLNVLDDQYHNLMPSTPGWYVDNIFTNKESGTIEEFIEKEGKWFNYLKGKLIDHHANDDIVVDPITGDSLWDQASFAIQGLGAWGGISSPSSTFGCTDPIATNYDATATYDDGTCTYAPPVYGCMGQVDGGGTLQVAATAPNYDCEAGNTTYPCSDAVNIDDGSCFWLGCTDPNSVTPTVFPVEAQIYIPNGPNAGILDDGSCVTGIYGCLADPTAINYNCISTSIPPADGSGCSDGVNIDDGSCIAPIPGCLGQNSIDAVNAANYGGLGYGNVNIDDGTCQWSFCGEPLDQNYNQDAFDESENYILVSPGVINDTVGCVSGGCTDPNADNYNGGINPNGLNTVYDDGSCTYVSYNCSGSPAYNCSDPGDGSGTYSVANGYANPLADCINNCSAPVSYNCSGAPNFNCTDPGDGTGTYNTLMACNSACVSPAVSGCTDPTAINYDSNATIDDGSCIAACSGYTIDSMTTVQPSAANGYLGYVQIQATSLSYPFAGSGTVGLGVQPIPSGNFNSNIVFTNSNYTITATWYDIDFVGTYDFLIQDAQFNYLTSVMCVVVDQTIEIGVLGCTDANAWNYDSNADIFDGSCSLCDDDASLTAVPYNFDDDQGSGSGYTGMYNSTLPAGAGLVYYNNDPVYVLYGGIYYQNALNGIGTPFLPPSDPDSIWLACGNLSGGASTNNEGYPNNPVPCVDDGLNGLNFGDPIQDAAFVPSYDNGDLVESPSGSGNFFQCIGNAASTNCTGYLPAEPNIGLLYQWQDNDTPWAPCETCVDLNGDPCV